MLFCAPSVKERKLFSFSLPLSHTLTDPSLPILTFSHGERFLSGRFDIAMRKRPSSGGGVGETDPEAGGKPPANTSALLKPDSNVNQRPGICIKNLALGDTPDQN